MWGNVDVSIGEYDIMRMDSEREIAHTDMHQNGPYYTSIWIFDIHFLFTPYQK